MTRILLIEDDLAVRKMLITILEKEGYVVTSASDGQIGLRMFTENNVDLVITDILMPNMEGLETIRELLMIRADVKVIAISGGGRMDPGDYLRTAKRLGAKATVYKPFGRKELLNVVEEVMSA